MLKEYKQKFFSSESLFNQTIIYGLGKTLYRIVAIILVPLYLKYLSPFEYGILAILFVIRTLLINSVTMGVPMAVMRFYLGSDYENSRMQTISTAFWGLLAIQVPILLFLVQFSPNISEILFNKTEFGPYLVILAANILLISLRNVPLTILRAQNSAMMFSVVSFSAALITLFANIIFVAGFHMGIEGILWGHLLGAVTGFILLLPTMIKELAFSFNLGQAKTILKFSAPLALAQLPNQAILGIDRFIIGKLVSLDAVGIYDLAAKIGSMVNIFFITPFLLAWGPYFFSNINREGNIKKLNSGLLSFSFIGMSLVLILSLYSYDIVHIIAPEEYANAHTIVPFICYGYLMYGFHLVLRMGLLAADKTLTTAFICLIGLVLSIFLNVLLTPLWGIVGPAITLPITFLIMTVLAVKKAQKYHHLEYDFKPVFIILLTGSAFLLISSLFHFQELHFDLLYKTVLLGSFFFTMHLFGIIKLVTSGLVKSSEGATIKVVKKPI